MKRTIALMLVAAVFMGGFAQLVFGDLTSEEKREKYNDNICAYAQDDASFTTNSCLWQLVGGVLGPVGVLMGCLILPAVPPSRIMGRTPEYVAQYTKCFNDNMRWNQFWASIWTCGEVYGVVIVGYFLFFRGIMSK
jgi:ABC-type spermidine/putrescine transport system permease subunit I